MSEIYDACQLCNIWLDNQLKQRKVQDTMTTAAEVGAGGGIVAGRVLRQDSAAMIPVSERLPIKHGDYGISKSVLVCIYEFGFSPVLAVAKCFVSSLHPSEPQWEFDADFYHLDRPYLIPSPVLFWCDLPELPTVDQCEAIRKREMQLCLFDTTKG